MTHSNYHDQLKHRTQEEWLKAYDYLKATLGRPPTKSEWGLHMGCTRERGRQMANLLHVEITNGANLRLKTLFNHQAVRAAYQRAPAEFNGLPKIEAVAELAPTLARQTVLSHIHKMKLPTAWATIKTEDYERCRRLHARFTQKLGRPPSGSEMSQAMDIWPIRAAYLMKKLNLPRFKKKVGPKGITRELYRERYNSFCQQHKRPPCMREFAELMGVAYTRAYQVRVALGLKMSNGSYVQERYRGRGRQLI